MKPSDDLFQLTRSLSQTEKRYIRIMIGRFSGKHDNNCLKLLDAMEKQEIYDEQKIKARLKNEKFIKQLTFTKNYLYKLVLKGLRAYHSGASPEMQIAEALSDIEILHDKNQHRQCVRTIAKARELSYRHERFPFILELIRWERKAMLLESYTGNKTGRLSEIADEEERVAGLIQRINDHRRLMYRTVDVIKRANNTSSEDDKAVLRSIAGDELLKDTKDSCYTSLMCRYNILEMCYYTLADYKECYDNSTSQVALLEEHMHLTRSDPGRYTNALNNHIIFCQALEKWTEAEDGIKKLRQSAQRMSIDPSENFKLRILSRVHRAETTQVCLTGEFTKGKLHAAEAERFLKKWEQKTDPETKLILYSNLAHICFGTGSYKAALSWISKILSSSRDELRQDILAGAHVLNLFIHFELGNYELLEHLSRSAYNYLEQRGQLSKAEAIVVKFIKNIYKNISDGKLEQEMMLLKKKLVQLFQDAGERKALSYFDYTSWIESKLENKRFEDVVKARNLKVAVKESMKKGKRERAMAAV
jgi:hypothetical protein